MGIKVGRFEMPKRLLKDEKTASPTFGRFIAEPFENGYGYTIGNSLRRVLLSSLEGAAITSVKIDGVMHEFSSVPGMVEDVAELILNMKKILIKAHTRNPKKLVLRIDKEGEVTAGDIATDNTMEILNPDLHLATLDKRVKLAIEMEVNVGRSYRPSEMNKIPNQPIGVIPMDSLFTPVRNVKYYVENTRVGHITDYDRVIFEITTDGRISPDDALKQASAILKEHLNIFIDYDEDKIEMEAAEEAEKEEDAKLEKLLTMSINEIELSVRSANCINRANIKTISELVQKSEAELLKYRNFGKKSLNEIKAIIESLGLSLGMKLPPRFQKKGSN